MSDGSDERALLLSQTDEYGLTTAELQELAYTCREAKQRAYCKWVVLDALVSNTIPLEPMTILPSMD